MKLKTGKWLIWLFRALVLGGCALMILSFTQVWWVGRFDAGHTVRIYGWGLRHTLDYLAGYVASDVTPTWQVVLAWVYVGVSIGLAIFSTWLKKWWGALLVSFVGGGFITYAVIAVNVVVENRLETFGIPLSGFGTVGGTIGVYASVQTGYTLACAAGAVLVLLGTIRAVIPEKIVKKAEAGVKR